MKKIPEEILSKDMEELSEKLSPIDELIPPPQNISPSQITQKLSRISRFKPNRQTFYMRAASLAVACLVLVMGLYFSFNQYDSLIESGKDYQQVTSQTEETSAASKTEETSSKQETTESKTPDKKPAGSTGQKIVQGQDYKDIMETLKAIDKRNKEYTEYYWIAFNEGAPGGPIAEFDMIEEMPQEATKGSAPNSSNDDSDHGKTNLQVEGVDEADIIKNDGKYIYWLSFNEVKIISALPADKMKVVSTISLKEVNDNIFSSSYEMFIYQDTLVVIGSSYGSLRYYDEKSTKSSSSMIYYGYNESVAVTIYNIKDRANPKKLRTFKQDGYYVSSRLIGKHLYLVTTAYTRTDLIEEDKPELVVPNISDTNATGKFAPIAATDIIIAPESTSLTYAVVSGLDITDTKKEADTKSYLGSGNFIYAGTSNIYVASIEYSFENNKFMSNTNIVKFGISKGNVTVKTSGSVPGSIIGQFAMDEYDNHFRIATTTSTGSRQSMKNNVYVLDENLKLTGKIEGLAPGETIYSARFMGEKAYLVTYMTTDPLFVIDLNDHANPKVLGQLEMPGFSNYLHPYSENLLIGFGKDSEEVTAGGTKTAITKGLKIALYDVSDPLNPTEVTKIILGDRGSDSEVNYNHKALLFSKEKNIIGLPVSLYGNNYQSQFTGYYVLGLDPEKGFEIRGKISHSGLYYGSLMRGTYIGNTLYTLSENKIIALSLDSFETTGSLNLPIPKEYNQAKPYEDFAGWIE